jgi:hypothetical protein
MGELLIGNFDLTRPWLAFTKLPAGGGLNWNDSRGPKAATDPILPYALPRGPYLQQELPGLPL